MAGTDTGGHECGRRADQRDIAAERAAEHHARENGERLRRPIGVAKSQSQFGHHLRHDKIAFGQQDRGGHDRDVGQKPRQESDGHQECQGRFQHMVTKGGIEHSGQAAHDTGLGDLLDETHHAENKDQRALVDVPEDGFRGFVAGHMQGEQGQARADDGRTGRNNGDGQVVADKKQPHHHRQGAKGQQAKPGASDGIGPQVRGHTASCLPGRPEQPRHERNHDENAEQPAGADGFEIVHKRQAGGLTNEKGGRIADQGEEACRIADEGREDDRAGEIRVQLLADLDDDGCDEDDGRGIGEDGADHGGERR